MGGTFGYMFFSTGVPYGQVAKGLAVPRLSGNTIPYAVGSIGAIIMVSAAGRERTRERERERRACAARMRGAALPACVLVACEPIF